MASKQSNEEQEKIDFVASTLSQLMGARVIPFNEYDSLNRKNQELLNDIEKSKGEYSRAVAHFFKYYCYFIGFKKYHSKWKPVTRKIENRTKYLEEKKLLLKSFDKLPEDVTHNIKEAYNCYLNGLQVSAYVMLLRTFEISINHIYDPIQNPNRDFVPTKRKLEWLKKQGYIKGADAFILSGFIEGRNEAIHTVYEPTEMQLMAAFEYVISFVRKIQTTTVR